MINEIIDKARIAKNKRLQKVYALMAEGVSVADPEQIYIRGKLQCGINVKLDVNVIVEGEVVLGDDVVVEANTILRDCKICSGSVVKSFSLVEESTVGAGSFVGPYARIRPNSDIGYSVQIGNFVEIKNACIGSNSRINHLSFVGDADLGQNVTIGAGTITCNHDSVGVNHTTIYEGAYIGSGCNLVAPLTVNANATVASGSTITDDVVGETLTVARARQVTVEGWMGPKSRKELDK